MMRSCFKLLFLIVVLFPTPCSCAENNQNKIPTDSVENKIIEKEITLYTLGIKPGSISPNRETVILFTIMAITTAPSTTEVLLEEVYGDGRSLRLVGYLFDDGKGVDIVANDFIYSGSFSIISERENEIYYRALIRSVDGNYTSDISFLKVSSFPKTKSLSDEKDILFDKDGKKKFFSNEILVKFSGEVSGDRIKQICSFESSYVLSAIPGLEIYQIHINGPGTADFIHDKILRFQQYEEVIYAEPSYVDD